MTSVDPRPQGLSLPTRLPYAFQSVTGREQETIADCYGVLDALRGPNGLYLASPSADYSKAWIRDNVYEVLPYADKDTPHYVETHHALLDILRRHEWKIDAILRERPRDADAYIHARFHHESFREFAEPWGNKQNDATGAFLWGIAQGLRHGKPVLRDARDRRLVRKLIRMHVALEYWHDPDNGMWEEYEEVHASSIGAVVAGLRAIRAAGFDVPVGAIERGEEALAKLLPRESATKDTDLALLSLIWPYRVVTETQRAAILAAVEGRLLRERGVLRYEGDSYYSTRADRYGRDRPLDFYRGSEAEWTFGLPWLSLIYRDMAAASIAARDHEAAQRWTARADHFLDRTYRVQNESGSLPESYEAHTDRPTPNTPLGWSIAMFILALEAKAAVHASR